MVFGIASSPYPITSADIAHYAVGVARSRAESQRNCGFLVGYSRQILLALVSALLAEALVLKLASSRSPQR